MSPTRDPEGHRLSDRDAALLRAVDSLPMGADGWKRAKHRDQLHETAGLKRTTAQRAADALVASGHVERQGLGQSARTPEGYRLTVSGKAAVGQCGPVAGQSGPVLVDSLPLQAVAEQKQPTKRPPGSSTGPAAGQIVGQFADPRFLDLFERFVVAVEGRPARVVASDDRLCRCGLPMEPKVNGNDGRSFLACPNGKPEQGGCGQTLSLGAAPTLTDRDRKPENDGRDELARARAAKAKAEIEATEQASRAEQAKRTREALERIGRGEKPKPLATNTARGTA